MSAKEELIAAALTVRDVIQRGSVPEVYAAVKDLRELCARAMCEPDMGEVERLLCIHENVVRMDATGMKWGEGPSATRAAMLDYVRNHSGEADKMTDVSEADFGNMLDCRTCAHFTADGCHSTATCIDAQQYKATAPRQYWTSAQQSLGPEVTRILADNMDALVLASNPISAADVPMPEPVAYGFGNTAITGHTNRLMMVRIDIPGDDQYAGAFWLPLVLADEAHTYGVACRAAGEAAGYVRGLRDAVRDADIEALRLYVRALCKAVDAATDFAGTVAGGASWWDDVWADHAAALDRARERISQAALRGEVKP